MSDSSRSNGSRKKKTKKPKPKKEELSDEAPDTESSDEELDLTKDCHPIAHYMDDRAEMISQMFSVIKGKKLKAMLPPILKDYDIEKLKLQCLDQLLGMSEKRINCILEGEILETSSESDIGSDAESKDSSDTSSDEGQKQTSKRRKVKKKSDTESIGKSSKISKTENEAPPVEQGKTLLEILELEMRARAIRALLKQGGETEQPQSQEDAPSGDIVDLTVEEEEFPTVIKTEPQSTEQELSFDNKVVKSVETEKNKKAEEKKKKLMVELELHNKLIKKKSYRTRQQRIENLDDDKGEEQENSKRDEIQIQPVPDKKIKEEPKEIVIEDAEDGEVTSEDEITAVVVKEEKPESPEPSLTTEIPIDGERIMAIDNGLFVSNKNMSLEKEALEVMEVEKLHSDVIEVVDAEGESSQIINEQSVLNNESEYSNENTQDDTNVPETDNGNIVPENIHEEDVTWRSRWLRQDEVQKVVKSSKICGLVKKRIAKKKIKQAEEKVVAESEPIVSVTPPIDCVEGSVREYEILVKKGIGSREQSIDNTDSPKSEFNVNEIDAVETRTEINTKNDP